MIYYLLPEWEVFSAYRGGALAHITAAVMRFDLSSIAVCPYADDTCGFGAERVMQIPALRWYAHIKGRFLFPLWMTGPVFHSPVRCYRN